VVSTALALPNVTVPGQGAVQDQVVTTMPGGSGKPSSVTVPSRLALAGRVTD
jgi:hypothetical protein